MERTSANTAAWFGMGHEYKTNDLHEAFKAYDLDYKVSLRDLYVGEEMIKIPGRKVTVREDNNQVFGIVSDHYKVIQNDEALSFIESIIKESDMTLIRGGHTSWGSYYLIGELPEMKVLGDSIKPHLIFQNSHDGSVPLKATICMLRLFCQNQFAYNFKSSPATIKILHKGETESKLDTAAQTLYDVKKYVETYQHTAENLTKVKVTPKKFNQIVESYFKIPESASQSVTDRILARRESLISAYDTLDNSNLKDTMWGVINAYTDYSTHRQMKNKESLFLDSVNPYGDLSKFIDHVGVVM